MLARPSKSLAAAVPDDVDQLIRVALSQDPDAALRDYVEHHRKEEDRCRQLSERFLEDHKKKLSLGGRLLKKSMRAHERYESAVASVADAGVPRAHAHKLRARALLLWRLSEAATIASLAAFRCRDEMMTEVNRHARQAEVVEGDVHYVLDLFSSYRLSPEQITHLIAIGADRSNMLKFLMTSFPAGSSGTRPRPGVPAASSQGQQARDLRPLPE